MRGPRRTASRAPHLRCNGAERRTSALNSAAFRRLLAWGRAWRLLRDGSRTPARPSASGSTGRTRCPLAAPLRESAGVGGRAVRGAVRPLTRQSRRRCCPRAPPVLLSSPPTPAPMPCQATRRSSWTAPPWVLSAVSRNHSDRSAVGACALVGRAPGSATARRGGGAMTRLQFCDRTHAGCFTATTRACKTGHRFVRTTRRPTANLVK